jgi:hypothetical protein
MPVIDISGCGIRTDRLSSSKCTSGDCDEASHLLLEEKPDKVAGIIGEFLEGKRVAGGSGGNGGQGRILVFDGAPDFFGIKWLPLKG